ncbi:EAL domain-containing protein [Thalassotalea sp. 1_MG-2023]|uniref:putative bifunctional diguanylate cyclase/phosphodiesterase n=1 Tax=Thalassotalea sp. 1_MG-2023 TaxID=3062680 RepID=UPI0026E142D5|nr:EAL domain-containing protein [Thalassotalea sp. 1_MG-2023]MDO6425788.1 EAL domain-containing protein [Thalassotalea sp. 1_MG-2023]
MMNKIFISVPTKLLLLVISALLLMSIGISMMSLSRLQQEFKDFQNEKIAQGQSQFAMQTSTDKEKLSLWIESFSDVLQLATNDNYSLPQAFERQYDALQMNQNVENIWLFSEDNQLLYTTADAHPIVSSAAKKVIKHKEPGYQLFCDVACEQLVVVPLLGADGSFHVVAMTMSLLDVIYSINQVLQSEISVVSFDHNPKTSSTKLRFLSTSNAKLMNDLFDKLDSNISAKDIRESGLEITLEDQSYLVNLMKLANTEDKQFYIALVDNVSSIKQEYRQQVLQFLFSAVLIFITLAVLVYLVASPFANRILTLSSALPLLARKEFEQFRQIRLKRRRLLADELDIVADSATELSYELEQLNLEVEQKTKELENIAMYDLLTGLPNRNMLNYQLRKAVANIGRVGKGIAVLFLDLDDFKKVNDSHGHGEGDKLLIEAANRVRVSVRHVDLACRFGGDEFVVVLGHLNSPEDAVPIAEKILQRFKAPIRIDSSIFYVSTSIGIAYSEDEITKPELLVSQADIAMYEAKDNGGAQYHIYHADMYQRVAHRVMMETEVRQALAKGQFSLSLQPQLLTKTKQLYGFEALLRWKHPEKGMISPDDFIPILENSEHMVELGYWVIRRCFELLKKLDALGLHDVKMAINLSAGQFIDNNLPHYLHQLLDEFNIGAERFELELTEQTLVKDIDRAIDTMNLLKENGFSFAIDDFGTGYSSLAYIKKMPIDVIKIDKSFIFGMLENHADYQIIMSTIAMVKNLGLTVIAEGVESSAQLRSLTESDCDIIQGYYFSKPIPEVDILAFVETQLVNGYWKTQPTISTTS